MLVGLLTVAIKSWGGGGGAVAMDMYWGFAAAEKEPPPPKKKGGGGALLHWFTTDSVLLTKNKIVYMCSTVSVLSDILDRSFLLTHFFLQF